MKVPSPVIPLQWALFVSHVALFSLPIALMLGTGALARDQDHQRRKELAREASLVQVIVEERLAQPGAGLARIELDPLLTTIFDRTGVGIRILDPTGAVVASSGPRRGELLADRPEVQSALAGTPMTVTRLETPPSLRHGTGAPPQRRAWSFATQPLHAGGGVVGAVLTVHANRDGWDVLQGVGEEIGWGALGLTLSAIGLSLYVGWRVSRSLRALARVAHNVTGDRPVPELDRIAGTRVAEVRFVAVAFRDMLTRLRERLRYNEEFASNVSHEFRTPLTTLRGTVDLLSDDAEMPAEQRRVFLENARTDLDRLLRMVQGLLDLARAESAQRRERINLGGLVEALKDRYPAVVVTPRPAWVDGDRAQLDTALVNLLENATLHGGSGVHVDVWHRGTDTGFRVTDDGPGIHPSNLPHVFERFFTTGHDREGTGLGLAIVAAIARSHGGEASVESVPGRTAFTVRLPAAPPP